MESAQSRRNRDATAPGDAPFAPATATERTRRSKSKIDGNRRFLKEEVGSWLDRIVVNSETVG